MVSARNSRSNTCRIFISPEGWWTLAGGSTPGNRPITLHPEGVPESIVGYPIRPISLISLIPPHPKSTFTNSKLTVDLGHGPLIRVENRLVSYLSPACHKPIIRPENKGIKPKSNRHKPKKFITGHRAWRLPTRGRPGRSQGPVTSRGQSRPVAPGRTLFRKKRLFIFV